MTLDPPSHSRPTGDLPVLPHPGIPHVRPTPDDWNEPTRERITLIDPTTETRRADLPVAGPGDVDIAIARARDWVDQAQDIDVLDQLAELIRALEARRAKLARSISLEIGAPLDFAADKQVEAGLAHLRTTLDVAREADTTTAFAPGGHEVSYHPAGVAALITPWNWPLNQVALKVGAALAARCAMILKPSELSTGTALIVAEAAAAAGIGPGQFTLLAGAGETGAALARHPGINIVSFTGSTSVGRSIAAAAGANLVPALLELGGKSPNLLFEDCDPLIAVRQGLAHCFRNAGQSCNAASRMLVARPIYDQVLAIATVETAKYRVVPSNLPGEQLGPLVSQAQFDRVQGHIKTALQDGARLLVGGLGRHPSQPRGYFARPTVFADVTPDMALFHNEVFGPVLAITPFDTEAEAIALANASDYGLAGYVQTADPVRQRRVAEALHVGMVQINGRSRAPGAPFGGVGLSGFGREAGLWGIRAFQTIKSTSGLDAI